MKGKEKKTESPPADEAGGMPLPFDLQAITKNLGLPDFSEMMEDFADLKDKVQKIYKMQIAICKHEGLIDENGNLHVPSSK